MAGNGAKTNLVSEDEYAILEVLTMVYRAETDEQLREAQQHVRRLLDVTIPAGPEAKKWRVLEE